MVYIDAQYNIVNLRRFQAVCSVVPKRVVIQEVRHAVTPQQYADRVLDDPGSLVSLQKLPMRDWPALVLLWV